MSKSLVISDLDGTLASNQWRQVHVEGPGPKRWETFFRLAQFDAPIAPMVESLRADRNALHEVVLLTGRPERFREETKAWLDRHRIPHHHLLMRPRSDYRPDAQMKRDLVGQLDLSSVLRVYDDRQETIELWQSLGLPVVRCTDPGLEPLL